MQNSWNIATLFISCGALRWRRGGRAQSSASSFRKSPDTVGHRSAHPHRSRCARDVVLNGRAILENCSLSIDVDHKTFGKDAAKCLHSKERGHDEVLEPVVRCRKFGEDSRPLQRRFTSIWTAAPASPFRAYNEGVSYRLETSLPQQEVKIYGEEMNLNFSQNDVVFYPQEDSFMSHNERKYLPQHLSRSCRRS